MSASTMPAPAKPKQLDATAMKQEAAKHTPGPWEAHYSTDEQGRPAFMMHGSEPFPHFVATCHGWITETGKPVGITLEHEANARLIAAAPELLAILKDGEKMLNNLTGDNLVIYARTFSALARAAIAKATA